MIRFRAKRVSLNPHSAVILRIGITLFLLCAAPMRLVSGESLSPEERQNVFNAFKTDAENGYADTQYLFGAMFSTNGGNTNAIFRDLLGIVSDDQQAVRWFVESAQQGYCQSFTWLGFHYAAGKGVPTDYVIAYKWLNLAQANGENPKYLETLAELMTREQIAEGQTQTRNWKPSKPLKLKVETSSSCAPMTSEEKLEILQNAVKFIQEHSPKK